MFIITGCGRSGTGYAAAQLSAAGIKCGHESVFQIRGPVAWGEFQGDSSWFAAPYLASLPNSVPLIHIVRNPEKVVMSFYRIGLFSICSWRNFVINPDPFYFVPYYLFHPTRIFTRYYHVKYIEKILRNNSSCISLDNEINRIYRYWVEWNMLIENGAKQLDMPYLRVKLEEIDDRWDEIIRYIGYSVKINHVNQHNTKNEYPPRKNISLKLPKDVIELAKRYGYDY